jgi:hypothetical protein
MKNNFLKKTALVGLLSAISLINPSFTHSEERLRNVNKKIEYFQPTFRKEGGQFVIRTKGNFETDSNSINYSSEKPILSSLENEQIINIEKQIYNKEGISLLNFEELTKDFSDKQKTVLLGDLMSFLYGYSLDYVYDCRHISKDIEKLSEKVGLESSVVSGVNQEKINHSFILSKTEDGLSLLDQKYLLETDSKNVEKVLEAYQKEQGIIPFRHSFWENGNLKYSFLTKDGKRFLDFLEYDNSLNSSLENLINPKYSPREFALDLETGNYTNSAKISNPFFLKLGTIKGEKNSALDNSLAFQFGFRKKFLFRDLFGIDLDLNSFYNENSYSEDVGKIYGGIFNSSIFTDRQGINLGLRGKITKFFGGENFEAFHDYSIEPGISYRINTENSSINPYLISRFEMVPVKLTENKGSLILDEILSGVNFSSKLENLDFLTNLYSSYKPYEKGAGADIELRYKNVGLNLAGSFSKSDYIFCPDKSNFGIGIFTKFGDNLEIGANYKTNSTNYDGEEDNQSSFSLNGKLSF